jgi:hypothetical protein
MKLTPEDLQQFIARRAALETSIALANLAQSGFRIWIEELRQQYNIEGPFDIDLHSGELRPRVED